MLRHAVLAAPLALLGVVALAALTNGHVGAPTDFERSPALHGPVAALPGPTRLRLVTFNIADAYLFTANRVPRMRAIAALLTELDPDLVGLQEAFIASDRALLWDSLRESRLSHHVRFPGATVGNGLWILSAFPIEEAWFHRFAHNGAWYRLWEGDWWAGKGVGLARVRLPGGALLDFFDTHAQAGRGNPENEIVRLGQMRELARFVSRARAPGAPAFVVGDFNTAPGAPDYALAMREAKLARAMAIPSRIDHIFAVCDGSHRVRVLDTRPIAGRTQGEGPELFLGRAPSPAELFATWTGPPGKTRLSDHPGYVTTVEISASNGSAGSCIE